MFELVEPIGVIPYSADEPNELSRRIAERSPRRRGDDDERSEAE